MKKLFLTSVVVLTVIFAADASAEQIETTEQPTLTQDKPIIMTPEQENFVREMATCQHKIMMIGSINPTLLTPEQGVTLDRVYYMAAIDVGGESASELMDRERSKLRKEASIFVTRSHDMVTTLKEVKQECDSKLKIYKSDKPV